MEISREDELAIEEIYLQRKWAAGARWGATKNEERAIDAYLDGIASRIDSKLIKSKRSRSCWTSETAHRQCLPPASAGRLGCDAILVNDVIDGAFPPGAARSRPLRTSRISQSVIANGADLGIAFDGDGDRSIFCDERAVP